MRNIGETLKTLREQNGLTRREVAEKLLEYGIDISDKTIYGYESGRSSANADMFLALCKVYKCNNILSTFEDTDEDILFTNQEWEYITKYRNLDDHGKDMVDTVLDKEWQRSTADQKSEVPASAPVSIIREPEPDYLKVQAAHAINGASAEDNQRDDDIMNDPNF